MIKKCDCEKYETSSNIPSCELVSQEVKLIFIDNFDDLKDAKGWHKLYPNGVPEDVINKTYNWTEEWVIIDGEYKCIKSGFIKM